jgi:Fe2+ or Zn2+ uptake regulation protein
MKIENDFQIVRTQTQLGPDEMLAAIMRAGYSNTRARRAVLDAIHDAQGQASPADLLALGRAHHPRLGLVTVYRTLDILMAHGLLRKLHLDGGCHTYAPAAHDHGHYVICECCHRTVEFEGCDISAVEASVEQRTGFRIRQHWLEMFGLCPECQEEDLRNTSRAACLH